MDMVKKHYSLPQDECLVLEAGYRMGTQFCQIRKQLAAAAPSCLDMTESDLILDIATDAVSDWLDSAEAYGGTTLTNDEDAFYDLYHRGFTDGWQDTKALEGNDTEHAAFNNLLGDIAIDL